MMKHRIRKEKIYNNNDIHKIKDYILMNKEANEGYTYQLREQWWKRRYIK